VSIVRIKRDTTSRGDIRGRSREPPANKRSLLANANLSKACVRLTTAQSGSPPGAGRVNEPQVSSDTIRTVSASAGNKISNASSDRVTSLAVPNTVTAFRKDTVPKRVDIRSGVAKRCEPSKLSGALEPAGTGYPDHGVAYAATEKARQLAAGAGVASAFQTIRPPSLLLFEPHQPELCGFYPNTFLDITSVFEKKQAAMEVMRAQGYLREYYAQRATQRANHARRISGDKEIKFAEAFQQISPVVLKEFR